MNVNVFCIGEGGTRHSNQNSAYGIEFANSPIFIFSIQYIDRKLHNCRYDTGKKCNKLEIIINTAVYINYKVG